MKLAAARTVVPWFLLLRFWTKMHGSVLCFHGFLSQALVQCWLSFSTEHSRSLLWPALLSCLLPNRLACGPAFSRGGSAFHQPGLHLPVLTHSGTHFTENVPHASLPLESIRHRLCVRYTQCLTSCSQKPHEVGVTSLLSHSSLQIPRLSAQIGAELNLC